MRDSHLFPLILSGLGGSVGTYNQTGGTLAAAATYNLLKPAANGAGLVNEESPYTLNLSASTAIWSRYYVTAWGIGWGDGNSDSIGYNAASVNHTYYTGGQTCAISSTANATLQQ